MYISFLHIRFLSRNLPVVAFLMAGCLLMPDVSKGQPPFPPKPPKFPPLKSNDSEQGLPAVGKLLQAIASGSDQQRLDALDQLDQIAGSANEKLQALKQSLESDNAAVRMRVLQSIGRQGENDPELAAKLKRIIADGENPLEKLLASRATLQITDDSATQSELIQSLSQSLQSDDPALANQAALALRDAGRAAEPALLKALDDDQADTRALAAQSLSGTTSAAAISKLQSLLKDADAGVRTAALIGLRDAAETPALVKSLVEMTTTESDPAVQMRAGNTLAKVSPDSLVAVESTLQKNAQLATSVVRGVADSGLTDEAKAQLYGSALPGQVPEVAAAITEQLVELGDEGMAVLTGALQNEKSRYWAVIGLSDFGTRAAEAAPELASLLAVSSPDVQTEILLALGNIKSKDATVAKQITAQLGSDNPGVKYAASLAALRSGVKDAAAEAALEKNAASEDKMLKVISLFALAKLNPSSPAAGVKAMRALGEAARSKDKRLAQVAALAIQDLKPGR